MIKLTLTNKIVIAVTGAILVVSFIVEKTGIIYNNTPSIPTGFYKKSSITLPLKRNELVALCIDEEYSKLAQEREYIGYGTCPGNSSQFLKRIVGVEGDKVIINALGVFINGKFVDNSHVFLKDDKNREMPTQNINRVLNMDEYVVMGETNDSFDSRYFGVVQTEQVKNRIKKVF